MVELGSARRALVVGDCVGHGLATSVLMGRLRAAARAAVLERAAPAVTLEVLDRFAATLPGAECTTVFCAVVDERAGALTYSSAGHPPPLVRHADGTRWLDDATGAPLVVHRGARPEASVRLRDAYTLLLYTDGLVERRGEPLRRGLQRLEEVLAELADRPGGAGPCVARHARGRVPHATATGREKVSNELPART